MFILNNKLTILFIFSLLGILLFTGCSQKKKITVFAGSASLVPLTHLAEHFETEEGVEVMLITGGMGNVLSQFQLSGKGDIFVSTSDVFMKKAVEEGLVWEETIKYIAFSKPALLVQKGNPKGVTSLEDLTRPDLRVVLARPGPVVIGSYSAELCEKNDLAEKINVNGYATSATQLAEFVAMGAGDITVNWSHLGLLYENKLTTIHIPISFLPRVMRISIAIARRCENPEPAKSFIALVASAIGKKEYELAGFELHPPEAFQGEIDGEPIFNEDRWK